MTYREFLPSVNLRPVVKCYYTSEYDTDEVVQDKAFATGSIELMFNLGNGSFQTGRDGHLETTPAVELWGQIIDPLDFRSLGKNKMLGIRFHPHTASVVLGDRVEIYNDRVSDFIAVEGTEAHHVHQQLLNALTIDQQLVFVESFLLRKLSGFKKKKTKFEIVNNVIQEMRAEEFCDEIQDVAFRYGISPRYLQKLFLEFTGLSPKLYSKIIRFQKSLMLAANSRQSLTSVAYQSGYFDQSHFIRDFKFFTGTSPSLIDPNGSSAILAFPSK